MSDNVFAKKRRKVNLHSTQDVTLGNVKKKVEREKAKPKSFSVFENDLKVLDDLKEHLEEETGQTVTKSFAMRMGIYYLSDMMKSNEGLTEDMKIVLEKCQKMKQIN